MTAGKNVKKKNAESAAQHAYWNALSDEYQAITRINSRDFHYGPQIPGESQLKLLPHFKRGMTALELGCGAAQNTLYLLRKGLECTAVDVSRQQLRHAARLAKAEGFAPTLICSPIETVGKKLPDGARFDFVHSSHAFEFVDDPCAVVEAAASFLKPGGTLMVSTVHPVYNGEWTAFENDDGTCEWGRFLKNYFEPEDDCRDDYGGTTVRSRAYPVSDWFGWLRGAGLNVMHLLEPRAVFDNAAYTSEAWAANEAGELDAIPSTIIFVAKKQ